MPQRSQVLIGECVGTSMTIAIVHLPALQHLPVVSGLALNSPFSSFDGGGKHTALSHCADGVVSDIFSVDLVLEKCSEH